MALARPIFHDSTWVITNLDKPNELPLMGMFEPNIVLSGGEPIWAKRPGIGGGQPWLRHIGRHANVLKWSFHAVAVNIVDGYPSAAYEKLLAWSRIDTALGRPPRISFVYGPVVMDGFITDLPEAPLEYWENTRVLRQIGPMVVSITEAPAAPASLATGTAYATMTANTQFEELASAQYQDARFGQLLAIYNDGVRDGDTIEMPNKHGVRSRVGRGGARTNVEARVSISPYLADDGIVEDL